MPGCGCAQGLQPAAMRPRPRVDGSKGAAATGVVLTSSVGGRRHRNHTCVSICSEGGLMAGDGGCYHSEPTHAAAQRQRRRVHRAGPNCAIHRLCGCATHQQHVWQLKVPIIACASARRCSRSPTAHCGPRKQLQTPHQVACVASDAASGRTGDGGHRCCSAAAARSAAVEQRQQRKLPLRHPFSSRAAEPAAAGAPTISSGCGPDRAWRCVLYSAVVPTAAAANW